MDGTLVDSRNVIQDSMTLAFEELGMTPPAYDQTRQIVGLSLHDACGKLAPEGLSSSDLDRLVEAYKNAFITTRTRSDFHEPLYEGAVDLLETLANQNCLLALATGKSHKGIEAVFKRHGIGRYFDTIWCADDGPGKPHPFMVLEAMKAVGVEPDQTAMVGDAIFDIQMGNAAGVTTHGVTWGFGEQHELEAVGAHHLHTSMDELSLALNEFAKV